MHHSGKGNSMTVYRYSTMQLTMMRAPWTTAGCIVSGIILGSLLVSGVLYWNHTSYQPVLFRYEYALMQENAQLSLSVRDVKYSLEGMDDQFQLLFRHDDGLSFLIRQPLTSIDSIARVRYFPEQPALLTLEINPH